MSQNALVQFCVTKKKHPTIFQSRAKNHSEVFFFSTGKNAHRKQFERLKMADSISEDATLVNIIPLLIKSEYLEKSQVSYLIERAENDCI